MEVVAVFGVNCVGKTAVGRALAERMSRAALIEIDGLRYMIVGGLVAFSGGASPLDEPDEYERQCELGLANAVMLARSFLSGGFSVVLDGLSDQCRPPWGWTARTFPDHRTVDVLLTCTERELVRRGADRGWWTDTLPEGVATQLAHDRANGSQYTCAIDTTGRSASAVAEAIARHIGIMR